MTALTVLAAISLSSPVFAGPPTAQLREYTDQVRRVLEDPALKEEHRRHERRAAVRKIAAEAFDVGETARRALGPHWQARTSAEREEFIQLFADLLERTYIARIDLYGGENIRYTGETVDGELARVQARIATRQSTEVPVEARLLRRGDRWLIYDISIENVSLISNYRTQFDRIIRTSSYRDLVNRLRNRQQEFLNEKAAHPRRTSS